MNLNLYKKSFFLGLVILLIKICTPGLVYADEGSVNLFFFLGTKIPNKVTVEIKTEFKERIIYKQKITEGHCNFKLEPGKYILKYKFDDKFFRTQDFQIFSAAETQVLVSYENHEFKVKVDHPKTFDVAKSEDENKTSLAASTKTVILKGRVVDQNTFKPIGAVNVLITGTNTHVVTDAKGNFSVMVPESQVQGSSVKASFVHNQYSVNNESLNLDNSKNEITLRPAGVSLEQVTVIAPQVKGSVSSMMAQRKNAMSVQDLLGSEQIAKSGDSSAASALQRVTGLSLVNGKFIYVRGLGERYSSTLLNGSVLPSPDPSRRVVPLDMFPTSLIQSLEVQKTYSADQLLEFGGGVVNIFTKAIPDKFYASISVNAGVSSDGVFSGKDKGLFQNGSNSDWLGYDVKNLRSLPKPIKQVLAQNRDINNILEDDPFAASVGDGSGFTNEEIQKLGQSFSKNYNITESALPANYGLNFEIGDKYKRGAIYEVGATAKLAYRNVVDTDNIIQRRVDIGSNKTGVLVQQDANTQTENNINLGGIFGFGAKVLKNHQFNLIQVLTRSTLNSTTAIERDAMNNADDTANIYRLRWQERQLKSTQLSGTHFLNRANKGPQINWMFTNSQASLSEPDFREYYYLKTANGFEFADDKVYGNERSYSDLIENLKDFKVAYDSSARLKTAAQSFMDVGLKVGYQKVNKNREYNVRRFKFRNESTTSSPLAFDRSTSLNEILTNANIKPGGFKLSDSTLPTDNYFASQTVDAVFLQASNTFNFKYKDGEDYFKPQVVYGLRMERSNQNVNTFDLHAKNLPVTTSLVTNDFLPSLGLNFAINSKHNLRLGFTKTLSRPDFKELSPARFLNDADNIYEVGNPNLKAASITNYDIRWEWFPSTKELISVGMFFKNFQNPIEAYAVNSTDDIRSYRNINRADNSGLEFEIRKDITEFIGSGFNTEIFSNYSYIASEVNLSRSEKGNSTNTKRPLQGQSPYLVNFGVDLTVPKYNLNTTIVYNVVGRRITDVGDGGRQDIYEEPVHQLDLSLVQKIKKNLNLTFRAQNILDPDVNRTQGDFVVSTYKRGRSFTLGLTAKL